MREVPPNNVTTTGSIEGWHVESYRGTVVAHAVAGAGLITEFFAGFSDMFGGRSNSVRLRLSEIYREATDQLRRDAAALGANWIVGFRADLDEVSGKGTFMFMVTATGTAVLASQPKAPQLTPAKPAFLSVQQLKVVEEARRVLAIEDPRALDSSQGLWEFIIQQRLAGAASLVLAWARSSELGQLDWGVDREKKLKKPLAFFGALPPEAASERIYADAVMPDLPQWTPEIQILVALNLLDLARTAELLEGPLPIERWWGLQSLGAMQTAYVPSDLEKIDRCIAALDRDVFHPAPLETASRALGMGKKQVWRCLSGHTNDEVRAECHCGLTRSGVRQGDVEPGVAREKLGQLKSLLVETFSGSRPSATE